MKGNDMTTKTDPADRKLSSGELRENLWAARHMIGRLVKAAGILNDSIDSQPRTPAEVEAMSKRVAIELMDVVLHLAAADAEALSWFARQTDDDNLSWHIDKAVDDLLATP